MYDDTGRFGIWPETSLRPCNHPRAVDWAAGVLTVGKKTVEVGLVLAGTTGVLMWAAIPASADAICRDGWRSYSEGSGTCSWHGGVARWLYNEEPEYSPPTIKPYRVPDYEPSEPDLVPLYQAPTVAPSVQPSAPQSVPQPVEKKPWYVSAGQTVLALLAAAVGLLVLGALSNL